MSAGARSLRALEQPVAGSVKLTVRPAPRYAGVERTWQPLAHPAGHDGKRLQALVPVSKAVTGATSIAGAASFK